MDPLGASASVAAVLQLTATVIKYLKSVKGASLERQRLLAEIGSINSLLLALQDEAKREAEEATIHQMFASLQLSNGPLEQFKATLERLESKLAPPKGSGAMVGSITWPFKRDEIKDLLAAIERQKTLFTLARQNDLIALSNAINSNVNDVQNELVDLRDNFLRLEENEEKRSFIAWLNAPDPWINQNKASKLRHEHTGNWFIESTEYKDWLLAAQSTLWLHGIPGCGKTILASTIIQNLFQYQRIHSRAAVIFYYFDFNDATKQTYRNLLRSLIKQLVSQGLVSERMHAPYKSWQTQYQEQSEDQLMLILHQLLKRFREVFLVVDALDESGEREDLLRIIQQWTSWDDVRLHTIFASRKERDIEDVLCRLCDDRRTVSIQSTLVDNDIRDYVQARLRDSMKLRRWRSKPQIQQLIVNSLMDKADGMFRWAACQLDALGDCLTEAKLQKALHALPRTLDETYARILAKIRGEYQEYAFTMLQWLCFSPRPLRLEELAEVVAISNEEPWIHPEERLADPQDVLTICSTLITTESITKESSSGEGDGVNPAIFYCRCRDRINHPGPIHPSTCVCFWPYHSADSLRRDYNEDHPKTLQTHVRLAHFSVKEYLTSSRIPTDEDFSFKIHESDAHSKMYSSCLAYLLYINKIDRSQRDIWLEYPLIFHATHYQYTHAQSVERHQECIPPLTLKLALKFLLNEENSFENWLAMSQEIGPPLYHASRHGLWRSVQMLLDHGVDVDTAGGDKGTAIKAAAGHGHEKVVQLLISNGAYVNLMHGHHPLGAAVESRNTRVVWQLLESGADANTLDDDSYRNRLPLWLAAYNGDEQIVQMLLDHGANTESWKSALRIASLHDQVSVIHKLLNHQSTAAQLRDQSIRVALTHAIEKASVSSVRLWLDQIDSRELIIDDTGRTPLSYAAPIGQSAILSLFMTLNKQYIDIADKTGRTPISYAAQYGDAGALRMLLKLSDQNIDFADTWGRTPISYAAARGPPGHDTVKLLLGHKGVDINSQDHQGRTPLSHAIGECMSPHESPHPNGTLLCRPRESGIISLWPIELAKRHQSVVKMLLDHDSTASKTLDQYGWTPLSWAVHANYAHLVELLLPYGHRLLDQVYSDGESLIHGLYRRGCTEILRLIAENGIIDFKQELSNDDHAWFVLTQAVSEGDTELVDLLLKSCHMNPRTQDERGRTLISIVAENGQQETLGLLLSIDSTTADLPDKARRTPLSYLCSGGNKGWNHSGYEAAKQLLQTCAVLPDLPDEDCRAPISYAAEAGSFELVQLLLDSDVDLDRPDNRGRTPLSYAVGESFDAKVVEIMVEKSTTGKDLADHAGRTPLSYAAETKLIGAVRSMLKSGLLEVNAPDKRGLTPLAYAEMAKEGFESERKRTSEVLRSYGAYRLDLEKPALEEAGSPTEPGDNTDLSATEHSSLTTPT